MHSQYAVPSILDTHAFVPARSQNCDAHWFWNWQYGPVCWGWHWHRAPPFSWALHGAPFLHGFVTHTSTLCSHVGPEFDDLVTLFHILCLKTLKSRFAVTMHLHVISCHRVEWDVTAQSFIFTLHGLHLATFVGEAITKYACKRFDSMPWHAIQSAYLQFPRGTCKPVYLNRCSNARCFCTDWVHTRPSLVHNEHPSSLEWTEWTPILELMNPEKPGPQMHSASRRSPFWIT